MGVLTKLVPSAAVAPMPMGVTPVAGAVQVRLPDATGYAPLGHAGLIPSGAVVDARCVLREGPPVCCATVGRGGAAAPIAAGDATTLRGRGRSTGLWAKDRRGRFRTRGRAGVATVRGTRRLTRETCAGTLTNTTEGAVDVRNLRTGRTVRVPAGHTHLARGGR